LTKYGAFYLYAGLAFIGWLLFVFCLPETKGLSLEEVETLFAHDSTVLGSGQKSVQYVHIRGINRAQTIEEQESTDEN
jgi:SP family myo-inositol transporter-like MFS transporter 13